MLYHGPRYAAGRTRHRARAAVVSFRAGLFAMVTRSFPYGLSCVVPVPREAMVVASRRAAPIPLRPPRPVSCMPAFLSSSGRGLTEGVGW
jgi:hypothetical protein